MADSNHTKGSLQVLITDGETMKGANCVLISENGDQIARCSAPFPFDTSWDERDANAHRLALAWNCHDELLKALIDLRQQINDFCVQYGEADFYTGDATKAIAKALSSAAKKD